MIVILLPCIMMPLKKNSIKKKNCPDFSFSLGTEIQSVNCWCLSLLHRLTLIIQKERCTSSFASDLGRRPGEV